MESPEIQTSEIKESLGDQTSEIKESLDVHQTTGKLRVKYDKLKEDKSKEDSASRSPSQAHSTMGLGFPKKQSPGKSKKAGPKFGKTQPKGEEKNPDTLLVEDVRVSQHLARVALQKSKRKVDVASTGEEAVEKFKKHYQSLTLVLMDIMLPKMNGVEATREIRAYEAEEKAKQQNSSKRIIILGLTGSVSGSDLQRYKDADMDGCIAKGELLVNAIHTALEKLRENPNEFVVLTETGSSGPHNVT